MTEKVAGTEEGRSYFSRELLEWYRAQRRDLPWRRSRDPYRIWVSEIMLQQTRVDTVIPYYERFMTRFPTLQALAEAPEAEVLKCWEGLGYYSRARNLQAGARQVMERHGGQVPDDVEAVGALKGIGPYTKGAVMSIAFDRPEPAVDGNVMRVLSRYFCLEADIAKPRTRVGIEQLARQLIPEGAAGDFNQGLMELGALICTPKSPGCLICPVMAHCEGRLAGRERELPIKTKAKKPRPELRLAALIEGRDALAGKILVRQRPDTGLLAGMWELPHVLVPDGYAAVEASGKMPLGKAQVKQAGQMEQPGQAGEAERVERVEQVEQVGRVGRVGQVGQVGQSAQAGYFEQAQQTVSAGHMKQAGQLEQMELLVRSIAEETHLLVRPREQFMVAEHLFSHLKWEVRVILTDFGFVLRPHEEAQAAPASNERKVAETSAFYELSAQTTARARSTDAATTGVAAGEADEPLPPGYRWIGPEDMRELAFPNVFLRILRDYWMDYEL
ncbi:A/G-specific adenine glycosylase [Paenibacillus sp. IB182496]|uniref:Adenine DNA glycosylase n=1 Tax=Paenibacillus sabuli TaxID=2772509 RepID=A0A927BXU9_9BACL|nr:A/G-specific adenine glycosylase [Paenibacillus sabuli]MBD2847328.1 A/G-specific adenine glycosylase [Paenibacillus sabuli]